MEGYQKACLSREQRASSRWRKQQGYGDDFQNGYGYLRVYL